jgi:hypothetical protein
MWGWVVDAKPRPLCFREWLWLGTHCIVGWLGRRFGLDGYRKIAPPPPPGFDSRTVQPIVSRCTDSAVPVHDMSFWNLNCVNSINFVVIDRLCQYSSYALKMKSVSFFEFFFLSWRDHVESELSDGCRTVHCVWQDQVDWLINLWFLFPNWVFIM